MFALYGRRTIPLTADSGGLRPLAGDGGYPFDPASELHPQIRRFIDEAGIQLCQHCFHEVGGKTEHGERFSFERCCWCGTSRTRRERVPGAHGRFGPGSAFG